MKTCQFASLHLYKTSPSNSHKETISDQNAQNHLVYVKHRTIYVPFNQSQNPVQSKSGSLLDYRWFSTESYIKWAALDVFRFADIAIDCVFCFAIQDTDKSCCLGEYSRFRYIELEIRWDCSNLTRVTSEPLLDSLIIKCVNNGHWWSILLSQWLYPLFVLARCASCGKLGLLTCHQHV